MRKTIITILILMLFPSIIAVNAIEPILITSSNEMEKIVFDGKWTDAGEWKSSSWDTIQLNGLEVVHIRSAHQGDFIYILLDAVADQSIDHISDRALVCIDGLNDKTQIPNTDDYCFTASLDGKQGFVYHGGSSFALNGYFKKISNPYNFIGIGTKSDEFDKYSMIPHASYEFKIPVKFFGRSDVYGFYIQVYDSNKNYYYSWPDEIKPANPFEIPSPTEWGTLVSPDKSLPEFNLPFLLLIPSIFLVIYITRMKKLKLV